MNRSLAIFASTIFLVLAALRGGLFVFSMPIAGYANQYDQVRTFDCVDLWPVGGATGVLTHATPEAPSARFVRANVRAGTCMPTSAVAAAQLAYGGYLVARALGIDGRATMDVRYLGGLYFLVFAALVAWNHACLRSAGTRFVHAFVVLFLLADPFNTLFFNTFYQETPAVIGFYAAMMVLLRPYPEPTRLDLAVFGAAMLALGFARLAHFALPLLFSALLLWRCLASGARFRKRLLLPLLLSAAICSWQLLINGPASGLQLAQRTNAVMEALAPNADDPARFLDDLGLPKGCRPLLGINWFDRFGHDPEKECPMLGDVSAGRLVATVAQHPASFMRALYLVQLGAGAWRLPYVGEIEGQQFGTSLQRWPVGGASFADLWPRVPFWGRLAFYVAPVLFATVALCRRPSRLAIAFIATGATVLAVWGVAILGDGFGEPTRHVHLAIIAALSGWILFIHGLFAPDFKNARTRLSGALSVAVLGSYVLSMRVPVALGYVDRFDGATASGWIIASAPLHDVGLMVGDERVPLAFESSDAGSPLARYFALPNWTHVRRWRADAGSHPHCEVARLEVEFTEPTLRRSTALVFGLGPGDRISTGRESFCGAVR